MQPDNPHADYIRRLVDQAPPLSEAQRAALATIFRPIVEAQAAAVTTVQVPAQEREAA